MKRDELIKALRHYYDLPGYMLDANVVQSCKGLPGWYWIQFCAAIKHYQIGWALLILACVGLWLLITYLSLEELAR